MNIAKYHLNNLRKFETLRLPEENKSYLHLETCYDAVGTQFLLSPVFRIKIEGSNLQFYPDGNKLIILLDIKNKFIKVSHYSYNASFYRPAYIPPFPPTNEITWAKQPQYHLIELTPLMSVYYKYLSMIAVK